MSTLLPFIAHNPRTNSQWEATVNHERAKNYLQYLDHRQRKTDAIAKTLITYAKAPLSASFPEEPSEFLKTTLKTLPSDHLGFVHELLSSSNLPRLSLSQTVQALIEPTMHHIEGDLTDRLKSTSKATITKRFQKAASYLYPRTLANHPHLTSHTLFMPEDTINFMQAAFNGIRLNKEPLTKADNCTHVFTTRLGKTSYIIKEISTDSTPPPQNLQIVATQEKISNLLFATNSLYITNIKAMTDKELVFEYLEGGDLFNILVHSHVPIVPQQFQGFCKAIISGLLELESKGFCHADLKLENIFLNKELTSIKIGDLGFTHPVQENYMCGSLYYAAPEMLQKKTGTSIASDIFSFGIILYIYLLDSIPEHSLCRHEDWSFHNGSPIILAIRGNEANCMTLEATIQTQLSIATDKLQQRDPTRLFRTLAKQCLAIDPEQRPSLAKINEMLTHFTPPPTSFLTQLLESFGLV